MTKMYCSIESELNHCVLDITDKTPHQGAQVGMYPYNGNDHQLWYHDINTGAVHSKKDNNFVLDVENNLLVVNRYVQGRPEQRFGLGPKHIYLFTDKYKVMDVRRSSKSKKADVVTGWFHGGTNQCWKYNYIDMVE